MTLMRLWHWKILPYLPKSQLLAQKRECDLIWKDIGEGRKTNHVLINYIWEYEDYKEELALYYDLLKMEFKRRGFNFNYNPNSIVVIDCNSHLPFYKHQDNRYLVECYFNLEEKQRRGQKDYDIKTFLELYTFVNNETNGWLRELKTHL